MCAHFQARKGTALELARTLRREVEHMCVNTPRAPPTEAVKYVITATRHISQCKTIVKTQGLALRTVIRVAVALHKAIQPAGSD